VRPAVAGVLLGVALAVGVPVGWAVSRPPAAAGVPVVQAVAPSPPAVVAPPTPTPADEVAVPARLAVPGLGVDAPLDPVGVRADGQLDLPEDVDRVGWYRFGPTPGAAGSAVLAGHVDSAAQGLGALAALREAAPGDEVQVTDAAGGVTRWRVVGRELIEKRALPLDTLFARTGPPRLVLITCGGPFLADLGSYRDNVVVVAEPAG
jgi:sortase (surface protein transpeptidase)